MCTVQQRGAEKSLFARFMRGDYWGLVFSDNASLHESEATVLSDDLDLLTVPRSLALSIIRSNTIALIAAIDEMTRWVEEVTSQIEELTSYTVLTRLIRRLQELARYSDGRTVWETHSNLAAQINTSQVEVTKALQRLRAQGLIAYQPHRRGITVLTFKEVDESQR